MHIERKGRPVFRDACTLRRGITVTRRGIRPLTPKAPKTREYPKPLFELRRLVGPEGRATYEKHQKLQVLEYSRLNYADGQPVGNRGAATVFSILPKLHKGMRTTHCIRIAVDRNRIP